MTLARGLLQCVAICGVSVLLYAKPAHAGCTKDTDCKGRRICEEGTCVRATAADLRPIQAIPARKTRRRSVPLMVTGIVFMGAGAVSAGLFGLAFLGPSMCHSSEPGDCEPDSTLMIGGAVGAFLGFGIGIPLLSYGKQRVPAHTQRSGLTHRSGLIAAPWVSAHSTGLSLSGNF